MDGSFDNFIFMAKKHTLTALLTAAYVIIMITIMLANVNISEKGSFEDFFDNNGGLIWACTTILIIALFVNKYLDIVAEKEKKQSLDKTIKLQETIVIQNNKSLIIQADHIAEFGQISDKLNRNFENDNETGAKINKMDKKLTDFAMQLTERDNKLNGKIDKIETWINEHIKLHAK